jgi:hypothetical protein
MGIVFLVYLCLCLISIVVFLTYGWMRKADQHLSKYDDTSSKLDTENAESIERRWEKTTIPPLDKDGEREIRLNGVEVKGKLALPTWETDAKERTNMLAEQEGKELLNISVGDVRVKIWTTPAAAATRGIGEESGEEAAMTSTESTTIAENTPAEIMIDSDDQKSAALRR